MQRSAGHGKPVSLWKLSARATSRVNLDVHHAVAAAQAVFVHLLDPSLADKIAEHVGVFIVPLQILVTDDADIAEQMSGGRTVGIVALSLDFNVEQGPIRLEPLFYDRYRAKINIALEADGAVFATVFAV